MSILPKSTQVLVVGGGPAGSTVAGFLAREGFDVTLVEKAVGPRYHIGESLLPSSMEVFDLLGAYEKIEAYGFQQKDGAYLEWGVENWSLNFKELPGKHKHSYQVRRAEFDKLLLEHAANLGAKVFEGIEIRELSFDGARPRTAIWSQVGEDSRSGELSFNFLIDASGRSGLMAARYLQNRQYHQQFQNVAVWGYWKGANKLKEGPDGAIAVGSIEDGWLWGIPLHDDTISIGVVIHKTAYKAKRSGNLKEFYLSAIAACPLISKLLAQAELVSSVEAEQDYSYVADSFSGPGYFLIGDAACFLDPLLSTGVHIATLSSMLAAACVASILRNEVSEKQASSFYEKSLRQAYHRLLALVSNLYDQKRGKEAYFREAQRLTQRDYKNAALNTAFLNVAAGVEDMSEIEDGIHHPVQAEMAKRMGSLTLEKDMPPSPSMNGEQHNQGAKPNADFFMGTESMFTTEVALDGWHLVKKPRLGLAPVSELSTIAAGII